MKAGLIALFVIGLVAIGVGAQTWASFSDTETSSGNYIQAGTLDLVVGGTGTFETSTGGDGIGPGDSDSFDITIQNTGTVDGTLKASFTNYVLTEGTPSSVDSGSSNLEDSVWITLSLDGNPVDLSAYDTSGDGHVSLAELESQNIDLGALNAGTSETLTVSWEIDPNADNGIQGDKITFDIDFELDQS
jgi:spore coat-associated protein N